MCSSDLTFVVDGQVRNSGVYALSRPDFDIEQAVALAGGALEGAKRVRIVRTVDDAAANADAAATKQGPSTAPAPATRPGTAPAAKPATGTEPAAPSVDDLLKQIQPPAAAPAPAPAAPPAAAPSPEIGRAHV